MGESKVCPLLFASACSDIEYECRPDRCAWAYRGGCVLTAIASALEDLTELGIVTYPED